MREQRVDRGSEDEHFGVGAVASLGGGAHALDRLRLVDGLDRDQKQPAALIGGVRDLDRLVRASGGGDDQNNRYRESADRKPEARTGDDEAD